MSSLLDLVGSFIVGSLLLLMILRVNNNVSQTSTENQIRLVVEENLTEIISEIEYDFLKIGYRVGNPSTAIISCDSNSIAFWSDIDNNGSVDSVRYLLGTPSQVPGTLNPRDCPLIRSVGGSQIQSSLGVTDFDLRYYNSSGSLTWTSTDVKAVEVFLQVESPFPLDTTYVVSSWRGVIYPKNLQ